MVREGIGAAVDAGHRRAVGLAGSVCMVSHRSCPKTKLQHGIYGCQRREGRKKRIQHQGRDLASLRGHVILDDRLHAQAHMDRARQDQQQQEDRDQGIGQRRLDESVILANQPENEIWVWDILP